MVKDTYVFFFVFFFSFFLFFAKLWGNSSYRPLRPKVKESFVSRFCTALSADWLPNPMP